MSDTIQTPAEGTEQEITTPKAGEEIETPKNPDEVIADPVQDQPQTEHPSSKPQPQPQIDYKDKFVNSQRESMLNVERVNVANARIESLTKEDTPTDEKMREMYPDWDELNEVTKRTLIKQETQEAGIRRLADQNRLLLEMQNLEDQLDDVIENSEYAPKLKGKEADFKRFAKNPKNRGIAADVLAKAFLFDAEDETPTPPADPQPREALPTGSGGPREPLKPKKISGEEAKKLRETNYAEWHRLVLAGVIEEEI